MANLSVVERRAEATSVDFSLLGSSRNQGGVEWRAEATSVDFSLLRPSGNQGGVERKTETISVDSTLEGPLGNPRNEGLTMGKPVPLQNPPGDSFARKRGPSRDLDKNQTHGLSSQGNSPYTVFALINICKLFVIWRIFLKFCYY